MAKRDYYEVLGIDKKADDKAIKRAYRKLAAHTAVQAAALAVSRAVLVAMAVIRSSILRVDRTVIWMISSEIFSGICSMAEVAAVSAARDSSRAMAAVLAAAVSRVRGRIFMQKSGSALKMQPLAVRK